MTLRNRYHDVMEHIRLTDEAKARILEHAIQDHQAERRPRWGSSRWAKQAFALVACLALVLVGGFLPKILADKPPQGNAPELVLPPETYETQAALEAGVGFTLSPPKDLPFAVTETTYTSIDTLAQIDYAGADGQSTACFRQSVGTENNSGDFSAYDSQTELVLDGYTVSLFGYDGSYTLAIWTDGTYAYSLSLSPGLDAEGWTALLAP